MKQLAIILFLCSRIISEAQITDKEPIFSPDRAPLFLKLGIAQKSYKPAQIIFDADDVHFKVNRTHSMGVFTGLEFALKSDADYNGMWTISPNVYFTSYSLNFEGRFGGKTFGLDQDAVTHAKIFLASFETGMDLNYYRQINATTYIRMGVGFNVLTVPLRQASILSNGIIIQNGQKSLATLVSSEREFFFNRSSPPLDQGINTLFTLGLTKQLSNQQMIVTNLRFCSSKDQNTAEKLDSDLGVEGMLTISKSFIGLDISYMFSVNQNRAGNKPLPRSY